MENVFWGIFFLGLAVVFLRILGDYGIRNLTAVNIGLLFLGKSSDLETTEVSYPFVFMILIVIALCLGLMKWKYARILTCQLLLFYSFVLIWPDIYLEIFPNNNLEEDFGWIIYDNQTVYTMYAAAWGLTAFLWALNRKLWKTNAFKFINIFIGAFLFKKAADLLLFTEEWSKIQNICLWAAALLLAVLLSKRSPGKRTAAQMAVMGLSFLLLAGAGAGILALAKESVKPKVTVFKTEPYEHLTMEREEKEIESIFFNERGETVLSINRWITHYAEFSDAFLISVDDAAGEYLINEKGEFLADSYIELDFLEQEELITAFDPSGEKYGALDSEGNIAVPFRYETKEEMIKEEKLKEDGE